MERIVQCHVVTALITNPVTKLAESVHMDVPDTGILPIVRVSPFNLKFEPILDII